MAGEAGLNDYDAEEGREELVDFECSDYEFENEEEEDVEIETGGQEEVGTVNAVLSSDKGGGAGTEKAAAVSASKTVAVAATPTAIAASTPDAEEGGEKGVVVGDLSEFSLHRRRVRHPADDDDDDSRPSSPGWRRARVSSSRASDGENDDDKNEGIGVNVAAAGGSMTCVNKGEEEGTTAAHDFQQNGDSAVDVPIAEQSASVVNRRRGAHDDGLLNVDDGVKDEEDDDDDDRGAHHAVESSSAGSSGSSGLAWEKHSSEEEDDDVTNTMLESLGGPREQASLAEASNVDGQEGKLVDEAHITEGTEDTNVKSLEREDGGAANEDKLVQYNKRGNDDNANNIDDGDDDDDEDDEDSGRRGRKRRKERFAAERKIEAEDLEREDQYSLAARMKRLRGTKWDGSLEAANQAMAAGAVGMMANPGEAYGRGAMGRGIMGPGRPPGPIGAMGRGGPLQGFMQVPGPGGHPLHPFEPGFASAQFEEMMAQQRLMGAGPKPSDLAALQAGRGGGRGLGGPGPPFLGMPSALGPVPGGPHPGGFDMYSAGPGMPPRGIPGAFGRPGLVSEQMLGMGAGAFGFLGPAGGPFPMCMSPRGIGMRPGAPFPGMLDGQWLGGMATGGPPGKVGPAMAAGMGWEENVAAGAGSSPTNPPKGSNRNFPEGSNMGNAAMMGVLDPSLQSRTDMQRRADIERHGGVSQRRNEFGRIENRRGPEMHDLARGELGRVVDMGRMDVGNRFDMARAGIGRGSFEMRNDVGRGDVGRGDYGRVDIRKGELMRGDIGRVAEPPRGDYVGRGELQRLGMAVNDSGRVDMGRLDMRMMDAERADLARMQSGRGGEYGRSDMMRMSEMGSVGGDRKGGGSASSRAPSRQERGSENGKGSHDGGRNRHLATGSNLIQLGGPVTKSRTLVVSNIGKDLKGSSIAKTFATSGDVTESARRQRDYGRIHGR